MVREPAGATIRMPAHNCRLTDFIAMTNGLIAICAAASKRRPEGELDLLVQFAPAIVLSTLLLLGCGSTAASPNAEHDRAAVQNADGSHTFYAGRGVGDSVRSGVAIDETYPTPFMSLQVPGSLYDEAISTPNLVKTASFEVPNSAIQATVHDYDYKAVRDYDTKAPSRGSVGLATLFFHPGDPWVTGYAQVAVGTDGFTMGLFEVIKWIRGDTSGSMPSLLSSNIYTTGLVPDPDKPVLLYADDPTSVPLPDNWK